MEEMNNMNTVDQMYFHIQVVNRLKGDETVAYVTVMRAEQDRDSFAQTLRARILRRAFQSLRHGHERQ
jgi:hypothetical protein